MAKLSAGLEPVYHPLVGRDVKLGKHGRKADRRNLKLAKYLRRADGTKGLPPIPTRLLQSGSIEQDLGGPGRWGMMGNDAHGDCTDAALGHSIQAWSSLTGPVFSPSTDEVLKAYWRQGSDDDGRVMLDVLNDVRKNGLAGHLIGAFVEVDRAATSTHRLLRAAVDLFGTAYIGLGLPRSAQGQTVWTVTQGPDAAWGSWGGHAVNVVDYDRAGLTIVTWGSLLKMTWGFFSRYCDEAYAIISPDFLSGGRTIRGFDVAALTADLGKIKSA